MQTMASGRRAPSDKPSRRVRFAQPIVTTSVLPAACDGVLPDSPLKAARERHDPRKPVSPTLRNPALKMALPHLPFARHPELERRAYEQLTGLQAPVAPLRKPAGLKAYDAFASKWVDPPESVGARAGRIGLDLAGVVDAVEESSAMRYGSYVVAAGGVLILAPVATVFVLSAIGLYAGYWGAARLGVLGASSARPVLGMPAALPELPNAPHEGEAQNLGALSTQAYTGDAGYGGYTGLGGSRVHGADYDIDEDTLF